MRRSFYLSAACAAVGLACFMAACGVSVQVTAPTAQAMTYATIWTGPQAERIDVVKVPGECDVLVLYNTSGDAVGLAPRLMKFSNGMCR